MNVEREQFTGLGALVKLYDELETHERSMLTVARRVDNLEGVLAGIVSERPGTHAPENRLLVLSGLKFGLIIAGVFLAGVASTVAFLVALSS
ncbi:MAG: hypothetical protein NTW87_12405 [Planctomycetota bacterium]|nr:hypothetical protein [Planctomycetota bacterium]